LQYTLSDSAWRIAIADKFIHAANIGKPHIVFYFSYTKYGMLLILFIFRVERKTLK
jgi:hypothetical protein